MKKPLPGIPQFRRAPAPERREDFARLALRQAPDAPPITCFALIARDEAGRPPARKGWAGLRPRRRVESA
jgi:hypothetical protein